MWRRQDTRRKIRGIAFYGFFQNFRPLGATRDKSIRMSTTKDQHDERFLALLLANQSRFYRFLLTLVPCREDAEDLFQQTCMSLWRNRSKFDPAVGDFASWACGIAHNHVRNFRRREATRAALLSDGVLESLIATRAAHQSLLDGWHRTLGDCLEKLTPHQRSLVEHCYGGSGTIKQAARTAGRTSNALYKVLRHIRALLHDCILGAESQGGAL
jgi:RNA polymerase sigma-70 factor, ECF subfamily